MMTSLFSLILVATIGAEGGFVPCPYRCFNDAALDSSMASILDDTALRERGDEIRSIASRSVSEAIQALHHLELQRFIVLHNLANANTDGFRRMNPWTLVRDFSQGAFRQSENQRHLAIEGHGFFQVILPDGATAFTRDGGFELDSSGNLTTRSGLLLQPAITIAPGTINLEISTDGTVTQQAADGTLSIAGRIELTHFINPGGLQAVWNTDWHDKRPSTIFWRESSASGPPITGHPGEHGLGLIRQGFVEISNVNLLIEEYHLEILRRQEEAIRFGLEAAGYRLPKR